MRKEQHARFNKDIGEGRAYEFEYFEVLDNELSWRPTTSPYKLTFGKQTNYEELDVPLPKYSFNFKQISEILNLPEDQNFPYLFG